MKYYIVKTSDDYTWYIKCMFMVRDFPKGLYEFYGVDGYLNSRRDFKMIDVVEINEDGEIIYTSTDGLYVKKEGEEMKQRAAHTREELRNYHSKHQDLMVTVEKALDKLASYEEIIKNFINKRDAIAKMLQDPVLYDVPTEKIADFKAQLKVIDEILGGKYNGNTTAN